MLQCEIQIEAKTFEENLICARQIDYVILRMHSNLRIKYVLYYKVLSRHLYTISVVPARKVGHKVFSKCVNIT